MRPSRAISGAILVLSWRAAAAPSSGGAVALPAAGSASWEHVLLSSSKKAPLESPRLLVSRHGGEHPHQETEVALPQAQSRRPSSHDHNSHAAPLLAINETLILETHDPDPLSYLELDTLFEGGYPGVLVGHIVLSTLSFFVLLPLALFLKAGGSELAVVAQSCFLVLSLLGLLCGTVYNSLTPDLYEGSSHSKLGWVVMVMVIVLNTYDIYVFGTKFLRWRSGGTYASVATKDEQAEPIRQPMVAEDFVLSPTGMDVETTEVNWDSLNTTSYDWRSPPPGLSTMSDDTLFDGVVEHDVEVQRPTASLRARVLSQVPISHTFLMRSIVVLAYVEVLSGVAVYTGSCRAQYGNGCMAHTAKGSIFLWYGLITFARYIGAFSSRGWAWNRVPDRSASRWTAEFVESLVCFIYGVSNTWLERLGKSGTPFSVKDLQHISIAVMFWFAGALGMVLESRRVRVWLSQTAIVAADRHPADIVEPASASFSFNPFPALLIGVTGIAMSAHHQTYKFQVEVHALWGLLLAGFAVCRCLTYFFLFLRPPASILPSRPPTEALASLCLTAGGVVFILSTEQVTFGAMRHGWDDVMAFLNTTVALVCVWFMWILTLFALQGK